MDAEAESDYRGPDQPRLPESLPARARTWLLISKGNPEALWPFKFSLPVRLYSRRTTGCTSGSTVAEPQARPSRAVGPSAVWAARRSESPGALALAADEASRGPAEYPGR
jgi:hypothetical protein